MTPAEFYDRLETHDWFFAYSDDPKYYHKGYAEQQELAAAADADPALKTLYVGYEKHIECIQRGESPVSVAKPARPS